MLMLDLKNFDILTIEDLRLIVAVVEEGSLTAGAARMRLGQSNASYSLKKIQSVFQASLFVRKGRKLIPSEFGWHVYHHTKPMLVNFQTAIQPPVFSPDSEFTLNFGATEYETIAVFPKIMDILKNRAPKAKIRIVAIDTKDLVGQIEKLDFVFIPVKLRENNVRQMKIFDDCYVTIFDKSVRDAPLTLESFASARHAIVSFDDSITTNIDHLLAKKGLKREVALSVFGFTALAGLMHKTDLITTLPKQVADVGFSGLSTCECPLKLEPMPLYLCWEITKEEQGKIEWFVKLMSQELCNIAR